MKRRTLKEIATDMLIEWNIESMNNIYEHSTDIEHDVQEQQEKFLQIWNEIQEAE